ncbi:MAG: IPT/TIG domain-containing protein [Bryobacteraceae bacterium]
MVSFHRLVLLSLFGLACIFAADTTPASYTIQTVAGSDDSGDGGSALSAALSQPEGIAVDRSGNVYVADAANQRIRKIATDGSIHTVAGTGVAGFAGDGGPASAAQLNQPYGLAVDSAGNLYIADLGNARVREVTVNGMIQTVAGGGALAAASAGQGGSATIAQLAYPRNVAIDNQGSLYISDFGANQVYRVATNGTLSLVAGTGTAGFSGDGTSALMAQLNAPAGLAVDVTGAVYIADSGNNRVRKVYNGVIIDVFDTPAPTGVAVDSSGMLYVAAGGYLGSVIQQIPGVTSARDVTVDSSGNIYSTSGGFVLEIPASSGTVTTIAGSGNSPYFGGDGGPATSAQMYSPSGIVVDSSGNWYIADTSNNRIRMVTSAGVISTIAGTGAAGSSGDSGPAAAAELNSPHGIAIDSSNNLYIADSGNNEVRKITPAGTITTIAGQLNNPVSVAVDAQGSIYIADSGNNRIAQVMSSGTASTFAKISGVLAVAVDASGNVVAADASQVWSVSENGSATSLITGLTSASGLAFASDGTLIIADTGANIIRQLSTSGVLTAIAGTGAAGFLGDGGLSLAAELNAPAGIAIGANGMLLLADSGNNRIRSLTPATAAADTPTISPVNAASLAAGPMAPGEIITIFGTGFDPVNTQLLFDGKAATLFYTSATQINALAPSGLAASSNTAMSIVVDGATIASSSVPVAAAAPGIFTVSGATGQAAASNQDGSLNSASNPAARGSVVSIYATGQGSGTPNITLNIAGYNAPLLYAGPAPGFPGLMQINAQIPAGFLPPGIQAVVLSVGEVNSQSGVTLAIH